MTQTDYANLKTRLIGGCMSERRDLIESMSPRQLAEFADRLDMPYTTPSQLETWRYIAHVLAIRLADYIARVDGPEACTCEMERAASPSELAALAETPITHHTLLGFNPRLDQEATHSLQESR